MFPGHMFQLQEIGTHIPWNSTTSLQYLDSALQGFCLRPSGILQYAQHFHGALPAQLWTQGFSEGREGKTPHPTHMSHFTFNLITKCKGLIKGLVPKYQVSTNLKGKALALMKSCKVLAKSLAPCLVCTATFVRKRAREAFPLSQPASPAQTCLALMSAPPGA